MSSRRLGAALIVDNWQDIARALLIKQKRGAFCEHDEFERLHDQSAYRCRGCNEQVSHLDIYEDRNMGTLNYRPGFSKYDVLDADWTDDDGGITESLWDRVWSKQIQKMAPTLVDNVMGKEIMEPVYFRPFEAGETLTASRLNSAFESVMDYNRLQSTKPMRMGRLTGISLSQRPSFAEFSSFPAFS